MTTHENRKKYAEYILKLRDISNILRRELPRVDHLKRQYIAIQCCDWHFSNININRGEEVVRDPDLYSVLIIYLAKIGVKHLPPLIFKMCMETEYHRLTRNSYFINQIRSAPKRKKSEKKQREREAIIACDNYINIEKFKVMAAYRKVSDEFDIGMESFRKLYSQHTKKLKLAKVVKTRKQIPKNI